MQSRNVKFEFDFQRLKEQADLLIAFYAKKKSKKNGQKIVKHLKKFFEPKRIEDLNTIKKQLELVGQRNMLEFQSLYRSINIRALVIVYTILSKIVERKEELVPTVETMKDQVANMLKNIDTIRKKITPIE